MIGKAAAQKKNYFSVASIMFKLRQFCPIELEDKIVEENPGYPIIMSDFTNW